MIVALLAPLDTRVVDSTAEPITPAIQARIDASSTTSPRCPVTPSSHAPSLAHVEQLTPADDSFHPPANSDRWWTETCWFSFDQPGRNLSATIYPLFRPNLNVCSLAVYIWDGEACEPWAVPYQRFLWHLAMPTTDLTRLDLEGLRYEVIEPLMRYRVAFDDRQGTTFDLDFTGLREPWLASKSKHGGHFDQPCAVRGSLTLRGEAIEIDCMGMRDRTWSPRPDDRGGRGTGYTYGIGGADTQFLLLTTLDGNAGAFQSGVFAGYLVRNGVGSRLVDASRRVTARERGYPTSLEIRVTDDSGRTVSATGRCLNRFANWATPGSFAWMSMVEWTLDDGAVVIGEDQEVWSIDQLGERLRRLESLG